MVRTILLVFAVGCGHAAEAPRQASASPTATAGITFRHGVVVNHWLASNYDEVHRYGGAWFDREDVAWIARHGFDHIRFRVAPHAWLRPDGTLDPAKLAPLDAALAWAAAEQVGVVIALTGFPGMPERDPDLGDPAVPAAAARIWLALARRYAATGEQLRFELLHSPPAKSAAVLPAVHAAALAAVRAVSPRRFVYLGVPGMSMAAVTASAPVLSDERTGLVVDFFEPKAFTFQIDPAVPPVQFPDAADPTRTIAAIDTAFAELAAWAAKNAHDREIYVAQVGVYHTADAASQRAYLTAVRAALDRHHLAWATYDYESGCAMRGRDGTPTIAYEALGLGGPRATETRYAIVERGKTTEIIVVRTDGRDVGIHQPIDDTTRGISALQLDEAGLTARYDSYVASGAERDPDAKLAESFTAPARAVFYIPKQDDPLVLGMLARRLLEHPGERVALEPDGEATGELLGTLEVAGQPVTSLAIIGADLEPIVVWLDADRRVFAIPEPDPTSGTIVEAHAAALPALAAAQHVALARRAEAISSRLQHRPEHGLLVRHARVFDPATLAVIENTAILIRGATIEAIGPDARVAAAAPSGIEQIDAANRFVMPGLWDSHTHISGRARALMQLASGVTTVRDMGNEGDLPTQVKRYDTGAEIGPHAVLAMRFGIEGNRRMPRVTTPDEARAIVERAARAGYAHIKVLDDIDPALVPLLARLARARGMRFSGHVPKGLTVEQFVAAGAQEIQHIGGLFRGQPSGARAYDAMIAGRVALLRRRGVTLDPTLSGTRLASGDSGLTAVASDVLARLPPVARRAVERGAFTAAEQVTVRSSHAAFGRAVRAAIDTGVTVVPGTDARLSGFALRHELAAYVDLGIPAARVLRMATLEAARNMKLDARSGSLARGKVADLIVIAGDPTRDIGDLRNIELVVKNGWILSPPALLETVNIRPPAAVGGG